MSRYLETQLRNLGISVEVITAEMTQEERTKSLNVFRSDSGCHVLLLTSKIGSVSLNLQCASLIIVIDMITAFYILVQILGRVERIGQKGATEVLLLWNDLTYDQIALHRIYSKIVPSLAGEGDASKAEDPTDAAIKQISSFLGMQPIYNPFAPAWGKMPFEKKDAEVSAEDWEAHKRMLSQAGLRAKKRRVNPLTLIKTKGQQNIPDVSSHVGSMQNYSC